MAGSVKRKWHGVACVSAAFLAWLDPQRVVEPVLPFSLHRTIHKVSRRLCCQALQPLTFCAVAPRVFLFRSVSTTARMARCSMLADARSRVAGSTGSAAFSRRIDRAVVRGRVRSRREVVGER